MKYHLSKKRITGKKYNVKKKEDVIKNNTAKMTFVTKEMIDLIIKP